MDETTVDKAIDSPLTDFEDALQYHAAESQKVDFIVTRNIEDFKKGNIKTITAEECVKLHKAKDDMEV